MRKNNNASKENKVNKNSSSGIFSRKNILSLVLFISLFLIFAQTAHALGTAPSKEVMPYSTQEQTVTFRIINNEHKNTQIRIFAQGELAQYVRAEKTTYELKSTDEEISVTYKVLLPSDLEPGQRTADIVALETSDDTASGKDKTLLLSALGVAHQLVVNVPYPGKYAEGILYVSTGNVNDSIVFTANIINRGSETINNVKAELVIKGPTNEEIYRAKAADLTDIASKSAGKIETAWRADVNPGMYYVEYVITYDDKTMVLRNSFVVGSVDLEISKLNVGPFTLGAVAEFNLEVVNKWNQPIDNAYADLQILDSQGNLLTTVKTNNFQAPALSTSTVNAYWNTKGMSVGNYDVRVIMHYAEKTSERVFTTIVGINSIIVKNNELVGNVVVQEPKGGFNSVLVTLVIILIIINVGWFVYFKFLKKKNET